MELKEILNAIIYKEHGWNVAGQFQDSYGDRGSFGEQNINALSYILDTVREALDSSVFSDDAEVDIKAYLYDLEEYLQNY
jgi:hypothetical protein